MTADEIATLKDLNRLREEVFDPAITRHNGRIVMLMGDDIYGDGVCISTVVQESIRTRSSSIFIASGEVEVESISRPIQRPITCSCGCEICYFRRA